MAIPSKTGVGGYRRTSKIRMKISKSLRRYFKEWPISASRARRMTAHCHGSSHPNWKGGKVEKTCQQCGKSYLIARNQFVRSKFCSRPCTSRWLPSHRSAKTRAALSLAASKRNHDVNDRFGDGKGTHFTKHGISFHSFYELRFYESALRLNMKVERNADRFPYKWEGKTHYYTPDFKLFTPVILYIEIKGWARPRDYAKLKAVRDSGNEIFMITGIGLSSLESEVKENSN